jgi:hypothetical protein
MGLKDKITLSEARIQWWCSVKTVTAFGDESLE